MKTKKYKFFALGVIISLSLLTITSVNAENTTFLNGNNLYLPLILNNYEYKEIILFGSGLDGSNLFSIEFNGENLTQITDNEADNRGHSWSPDGEYVLFYSDIDGDNEIYVVGKDGSGLTQLTNNSDNDIMPKWSHDGSKILFISNRDFGYSNYEIYSCSPEGSNQLRLTNNSTSESNVIWSPDDQKIAFTSGGSLYYMDADGNNITQVTDFSTNAVYTYDFDWSPDLSKFVFRGEINCPICIQEIYSVNTDGSQLTNLTNSNDVDLEPKWNSAGTKIAYSCSFDICIMDMNTYSITKLAESLYNERYPSWSGNDQYITFSSNRDGDNDIYIIKTDNTDLINLTNNSVNDWQPIFAPN